MEGRTRWCASQLGYVPGLSGWIWNSANQEARGTDEGGGGVLPVSQPTPGAGAPSVPRRALHCYFLQETHILRLIFLA
jgi:hypothetical protein